MKSYTKSLSSSRQTEQPQIVPSITSSGLAGGSEENTLASTTSTRASAAYKKFAKNFSSISTYSLKSSALTRLSSSGTKESLANHNNSSSDQPGTTESSSRSLRKYNSLAEETSNKRTTSRLSMSSVSFINCGRFQ